MIRTYQALTGQTVYITIDGGHKEWRHLSNAEVAHYLKGGQLELYEEEKAEIKTYQPLDLKLHGTDDEA